MSEPGALPTVYCRHLIVCRTVWYDANRPDDGFSLGKLIVSLRPADGAGYPVQIERLFLFAQLFGESGEYPFRIRVVRVDRNDIGEEVEIQLGPNDSPREYVPNRPLVVSGEELVDQIAVPLNRVAFREPGLYEFQLWLDFDSDEPLASERLEARG